MRFKTQQRCDQNFNFYDVTQRGLWSKSACLLCKIGRLLTSELYVGLSDRVASTFDVCAFLTFAATKKMLTKGEHNYMVVDGVQGVLQATQLAAFLREIIVSRLRNMTPMLEF